LEISLSHSQSLKFGINKRFPLEGSQPDELTGVRPRDIIRGSAEWFDVSQRIIPVKEPI